MTQAITREIGQLARFGLVGFGATAIYYSVIIVLIEFGLGPQPANILAFLIANGMSFLGHLRFTFRTTGQEKTRMARFFVVGIGGYLLSVLITALSFEVLGFPAWISAGLVVLGVSSLSWVASRFWIFRDN